MNINNYFKRSKVLFQRGVSILLMSVINKNDDGLTKSDDASLRCDDANIGSMTPF